MSLDIQITDEDLPVLPVVANQALDLLQNPDVDTRKIDELIRQDPSLTQRILRVANSPFYAGRTQSQTIWAAVVRLGVRQLRCVILTAATGELFKEDDVIIQNIWDHSIATAVASHVLAEQLSAPFTGEAFIAGMLHDVGKVVIYRQHPEVYAEAIDEARQTGRRVHEVEEKKFTYFTHMSVGGLITRKWKLLPAISESARLHHDFERAINEDVENAALVCVVSLASEIVDRLGIGDPVALDENIDRLACADYLKIQPPQIESIAKKVMEQFEAQCEMMS